MYKGYSEIFSELGKYLDRFPESGYSEACAQKIAGLLETEEDTPLFRVFSVFGCGIFDRCALVLGLLTASGATAARRVSDAFGIREGCITPAAVSGLFFGLDDIMPFYSSLAGDTPLSRLFEGVGTYNGSLMAVRDHIAAFVFNGMTDDDAFLPDDKDTSEYIPLCDSLRVQDEIISFLKNTDPAVPAVLQVTGESGSGRHTALKRAFDSIGQNYIPIELSSGTSFARIRELSSKLLLLGAVPVLDVSGDCRELRLLAEETGLAVAVTERELSAKELSVPSFTVRINRPDAGEQYLLWQEKSKSFTLAPDTDLSELTGEFDMTPGDIDRALSFASMLSKDRELSVSSIKNGCYRSFASDMGDKAVRLEAVFGWDDIVLPERSRELLSQACSQVRLRHRVYSGWGFQEKLPYGRGVSMIFTGPPGTGKTMGAQVMAKELGMDIYRISLANVVSKYIGETEKNLNEIFEKAKSCRVILFFDEADVLFAKRTEVKDSNDKYSNMESAFLLQKMEEYSGVVILATNLVQNFDEAFKRRMRFIIEFPFPDAARRRVLWKKAFPEKTPLGDIDVDFLVEHYELSGSNIKNIALQSAFLAAAENSSAVEMKHIIQSVRNEYAKSGKSFTRAEAGEYYCLL